LYDIRPDSGRKRAEKKVIKVKKKNLFCFSLNARSIVNKVDLYKATVFDLQPDIIGVTES